MKALDIIKKIFKGEQIGKTAREIHTETSKDRWTTIWEELALEADYHPLIKEYYKIVTPKYDRLTRYAEYDIMELTIPEINSALDIYKSEICAGNVDGKYFDIYLSQDTHRRILEETLQNWINDLEYSTGIKFPDLIKRLLKYGDMFLVPRLAFEGNKPIAVESYELVPEEHIWKAIVEDKKKIYWIRLPMLNKKMLTTVSTQKIPDILLRVNILRFKTEYDLKNFLNKYDGNIEPYVIHIKINPDSFLPYGTCLASDTLIPTTNGLKEIKDIQKGDIVYAFDFSKNNIVKAKVLETKCNGLKTIYEIKTRHRTIKATDNHPFLVYDKKTKKFIWKQVKELIPNKDYIVISTYLPSEEVRNFVFEIPEKYICSAKPKIEIINKIKEIIKNNPQIKEKFYKFLKEKGVKSKNNQQRELWYLLNNKKYLKLEKIKDYLKFFIGDFSFDYIEYKLKPQYKNITFPAKPTKELCYLIGYLLGDGWINKNNHYIAWCKDPNEILNEKILYYWKKIFNIKGSKWQGYKYRIFYKPIVFFFRKILQWEKDKAHNKEIPSWIFTLPVELKESFLEGFIDADGHWVNDKHYKGKEYARIKICNKKLLTQIQFLAQSCGWKTGKILVEKLKKYPKINGKEIKTGESYVLNLYRRKHKIPFDYELLKEIKPIGKDYVYDIQVENHHNFVANGIIVHNSILEGVRLMWKQLKILDDAIIIMRIFRGIERLIWKIKVGKVPPREAEKHIQEIKQRIRKSRAYKEGLGLEEGPHILGLVEDLFLPVVEGREIELDTIAPATNIGEIEDVLHFRKRFYAGLKIPRTYLQFEEIGESGKHLALQDSKFASLIRLYQEYIAMGFRDALRLHLELKSRQDKNFAIIAKELRVKMKPPPTTHEETVLEIMDARIDIAQKYLNFGFKKDWVLKNVLHSSEDDLEDEEPRKKETPTF